MLPDLRICRLFRHLLLACAICATPVAAHAQYLLPVDSAFTEAWVMPQWYRDAGRSLTLDDMTAGRYAGSLKGGDNPYLTFGTDQAPYWFHFVIQNDRPEPLTLVLRLNRKNIDRFELWQIKPGGRPDFLGKVGANMHNDVQYILTDGFHFPLTLQPGKNEFWAQGANHIGSMYLNLSLHSPGHFGMLSRQNIVLLGIFLGVMLVSLMFSLVLFIQFRDVTYLLYGIYILNILVRELYNYSADYGLLTHIGHQCISSLIAATFAQFLRNFLRLRTLSPRWDKIVKGYIIGVVGVVTVIWILEASGRQAPLRPLFTIVNAFFILFTFNALYLSIRFFKKSERARLTLLAFMPLSLSFMAILFRNLAMIPSYPAIQHAVVVGFIIEVLVFTIALSKWHRSVETDRNLLQLELEMEQQKKEMEIREAEQQVKDQIARDLHDDVAASMSSIRILSQVAHSQLAQKAPEAAPILGQISRNAQATLESISDLIWAVKPNADYLNDMADRMREYAVRVLDAKDIDYQMDIPRNLPMRNLDISTRRNVYLIFKEAVNNAVKYSDCSRMDISLHVTEERLMLRIADNGKGFDTRTVERGNGLNNMLKRAADICGELTLSAAPGAGAAVQLSLPLV
ncbi:MAG: hypothetical protein H6565_07100 [Lewinellaceae bacterium]|nr:hypothetical protein [Lewinellaceae bacterium]